GWQMAGRLASGAGGVLLTVQLTKMGTDWFAGKEIATAMAIFVNSWPAGGRRAAGLADPVRRRDHDPRPDRPDRRPSGRPDHEPDRPRARAGNEGDRDGRVLHSLLCRDDAGTGGGGPARQIGRH